MNPAQIEVLNYSDAMGKKLSDVNEKYTLWKNVKQASAGRKKYLFNHAFREKEETTFPG